MSGFSCLLILLVSPQDLAQKPDPGLDRARRAAIVDEVMAEPPKPRFLRPAPAIDPPDSPVPVEVFDRHIFDDDVDRATRQARLEALLVERIRLIGNARRLEPDQVSKLRLAGSGDIKRLFDRTDQRRLEFESKPMSRKDAGEFLNQSSQILHDFRFGPFGPDTLFLKTLRKFDQDARSAVRAVK